MLILFSKLLTIGVTSNGDNMIKMIMLIMVIIKKSGEVHSNFLMNVKCENIIEWTVV